ncbi:hypothetical protein IV203_038340 [Nitzschia inconspicua]|uniref:Uncharacterized protein n=1 Tax=Nitzschia inconspicua TaxID=303405 RepID=A0A9K3LN20_9STRA|nr:hypothetical protein IV203_038340 [Nitzschia inconspicua]
MQSLSFFCLFRFRPSSLSAEVSSNKWDLPRLGEDVDVHYGRTYHEWLWQHQVVQYWGDKKKKVDKVIFVLFNEAEEEERRKRGVALRTRIRREKERLKLQQNMAQITPQHVWTALVNATNLVGLNTLAANNAGFRRELYSLFGYVAAVPNSIINTQQPNALGVLNAMVAAAIPFPTLAGNPDIMDCLYMIGALPTFRPFLAPPRISDGSDHDGGGNDDDEGDEKKDGDKKGGNHKKRGNDGAGSGGGICKAPRIIV